MSQSDEISYEEPNHLIDLNEYDRIISIGNKCPTDLILTKKIRWLRKKRGPAYPFGSIPTQPHLILRYIKETYEGNPLPHGFLDLDERYRNPDDVWFGHYAKMGASDRVNMFQGRFARLHETFKSDLRILLMYTSEADVYNEMGSRYRDNYADLLELRDYLLSTYPEINFDMMLIHTNKKYEDENRVFNYTMTVPDRYWTETEPEGNRPYFTKPYRNTLADYVKKIFKMQ